MHLDTSFALQNGLTVTGTRTAGTVDSIHYAAVIAEGDVSVRNCKFEYKFDPVAINKIIPTYDITNLVNGKAEVKDVVYLTFFSHERTPQGVYYYSFARLIFRGDDDDICLLAGIILIYWINTVKITPN